jgi:hypothetical protein
MSIKQKLHELIIKQPYIIEYSLLNKKEYKIRVERKDAIQEWKL